MESDPTKKSEGGNPGSQWDILTEQVDKLKTKASAGTLMEEYGDRVIYTDENGAETRMTLNPWAMANNALKSPEDMLLTGQVFEHMAKKWGDDDRNPSQTVVLCHYHDDGASLRCPNGGVQHRRACWPLLPDSRHRATS